MISKVKFVDVIYQKFVRMNNSKFYSEHTIIFLNISCKSYDMNMIHLLPEIYFFVVYICKYKGNLIFLKIFIKNFHEGL